MVEGELLTLGRFISKKVELSAVVLMNDDNDDGNETVKMRILSKHKAHHFIEISTASFR